MQPSRSLTEWWKREASNRTARPRSPILFHVEPGVSLGEAMHAANHWSSHGTQWCLGAATRPGDRRATSWPSSHWLGRRAHAPSHAELGKVTERRPSIASESIIVVCVIAARPILPGSIAAGRSRSTPLAGANRNSRSDRKWVLFWLRSALGSRRF